MERLSSDTIRAAFSALSVELESTGARSELALAGGAALVLMFGARESTKDVDVLILGGAPRSALDLAARRVAESLGLPGDWLKPPKAM